MVIITNNPLVKEKLTQYVVEFEDCSYIDILNKVRYKIHSGHRLMTHPLYGSVKPYETMYRTVVLEEGKDLDLESLSLIEDAIVVTETFIRNKRMRNWPESVIEDFQVIDLDLIEQTLQRFI
ncbi:GrdX family protein [Filifactor villosus]|uniref:GrdX family protein n=1 Tax=Filifactor villosus TaxID=29374 RepID=A0ABV9QK04_9FIRM